MPSAKCPYCDIEVSLEAVDAEDGCCPECGAMMTPGSIFDVDDDETGLDDDLDDDILGIDDEDLDIDDEEDIDLDEEEDK